MEILCSVVHLFPIKQVYVAILRCSCYSRLVNMVPMERMRKCKREMLRAKVQWSQALSFPAFRYVIALSTCFVSQLTPTSPLKHSLAVTILPLDQVLPMKCFHRTLYFCFEISHLSLLFNCYKTLPDGALFEDTDDLFSCNPKPSSVPDTQQAGNNCNKQINKLSPREMFFFSFLKTKSWGVSGDYKTLPLEK